MSDGSSARLFGEIFEKLAENSNEQSKEFAHWLWVLSRDYDFYPSEMSCGDALIKLGLAKFFGDELVYHGEDPYGFGAFGANNE